MPGIRLTNYLIVLNKQKTQAQGSLRSWLLQTGFVCKEFRHIIWGGSDPANGA
jgi:hypothetical protein